MYIGLLAALEDPCWHIWARGGGWGEGGGEGQGVSGEGARGARTQLDDTIDDLLRLAHHCAHELQRSCRERRPGEDG